MISGKQGENSTGAQQPTLSIEVSAGVPNLLLAPEQCVYRMLTNYVSNAFKYAAPETHVLLTVQLRLFSPDALAGVRRAMLGGDAGAGGRGGGGGDGDGDGTGGASRGGGAGGDGDGDAAAAAAAAACCPFTCAMAEPPPPAGEAARRCTQVLVVEVADEGCGVPDAEKGKVFGLHYRAANATRGSGAQTPGLGIGLASVAKMAAAHGGACGVVDVVHPGGQGVAADEEEEQEGQHKSPAAAAAAAAASAGKGAPAPPRVSGARFWFAVPVERLATTGVPARLDMLGAPTGATSPGKVGSPRSAHTRAPLRHSGKVLRRYVRSLARSRRTFSSSSTCSRQ